MEKRRSPRHAVNLSALVQPARGRDWHCTIRDFCANGMLLLDPSEGQKPLAPGISQGELVGIHFRVATRGKNDSFHLQGKIVRVMNSGVGINFPDGIDKRVMALLLDHVGIRARPTTPNDTRQQPGSAGGIKPEDARKVIAQVRQQVAVALPEMISTFSSYMTAELRTQTRHAGSNASESEYFAARSDLEQAREQIESSFIEQVLDRIDNPRDQDKSIGEQGTVGNEPAEKQSGKIELSLVDTDEFEDWLVVANIIAHSERVNEKLLKELQARLGLLVPSWEHNEANPLGPSVCYRAFDHAIRQIELPKEIRQKVVVGFETSVLPLFNELYVAATRVLEESGLFSSVDASFISSRRVTGRQDHDKVPQPPTETVGDSARRPASGGQAGEHNASPAASARTGLEPGVMRESHGSRDNSHVAVPQRWGDINQAINNIYSTVRKLAGSDNEATAGDNLDHAEDVNLVEPEEVQGLLSSLQQAANQGRQSVRQRLQESVRASGERRRIPPRMLQSIGVVESLIDTIEDDNLLSGSAKEWVRQLELTLDKVATSHTDFLNDENSHGSLEVLNQLARLGGSESGSVRRSVDEIIGFINDNFDANPGVFDEALEKLRPLIERQSRSFTGNMQRAVKASEGQQTLANARRAVVDAMHLVLAGQQVPELLLKLLMPGWRNLLVNTHLRQGGDSDEWRKQVQVVSLVRAYLDHNVSPQVVPGYMPPDQLIEEIDAGLTSIAFEPGQRAPLINALRRYIVNGEDTSQIPLVSVPQDTVADTLGFGDFGEKDLVRQEIRDANESNEDWQRWLDQAGHLHVGEWLEVEGAADTDEIAIIAWVDEGQTTFVLVNRRGVKTHEILLEDLALRLEDGSARILEESDIPLTDRASHRMLQNMYNQLTHQATHDKLTGLINRKEFERELTRALDVARRNDVHHLVAYMDLDQFKVINNSAGHEAGDKLLVEIADTLRGMSVESMTLARLGGDEFGILIENCEADAGMLLVKQLCDAVRNYRFTSGKDVFSLTASCGLVHVDKNVDGVSAILSGADSACYTAKDAGRDRIHVYKPDDSVMEHRRDIMDFVSQIDKAISEDRFILNCQKIESIERDTEQHDHYEILLTVLDENNEAMPPQDFIVAAETYNRIGLIDRWVIRHAFQFIASNAPKLNNLGAFSINISGDSLTEDDFMAFVLEQFKETQVPASMVCFEITETSAIGRLDAAIDFMEKLKVIGVQFSLDDFGTGLSSYSYLRNLPVDFLKIDGIFVKDIKDSPSDYAVVKSINEIGHFMGKKTIAEYVENDEVLEILREIGVDFAQGYGIERKRPIVELVS